MKNPPDPRQGTNDRVDAPTTGLLHLGAEVVDSQLKNDN